MEKLNISYIINKNNVIRNDKYIERFKMITVSDLQHYCSIDKYKKFIYNKFNINARFLELHKVNTNKYDGCFYVDNMDFLKLKKLYNVSETLNIIIHHNYI